MMLNSARIKILIIMVKEPQHTELLVASGATCIAYEQSIQLLMQWHLQTQ